MDFLNTYTEKIGINDLSVAIEETFNNTYSILVYDELNILWIEKFANNLTEAEIIAQKLFIKAKKQLLNGYN
jgi:hypothetical protein